MSDSPQPRAPYVRFFPTDWKAGVAGLPISVEWTYLQICIHNWDKGAALPEALFDIVLGRNPDWQRDLDLLIGHLGKITKTMGGGVFSERAMAEARLAQDSLEKRRTGGKKGAAKRWSDNELDGSPNGTPNGIPNGNQNQNQNQSPLSDDKGGAGAPVGDMVFSVPDDAWREFKQHRDKLKKSMTPKAESLMLKKLERIWADTGEPPGDVLDRSIENGWAGVFARDGGRNAGNQRDNRSGLARAIDRQLDEIDRGAGADRNAPDADR